MIRTLEIRDLVVIERAELAPAPGLTAITGESGAGKTVLTQALGLLAGGRADPSAVRPGASHALVQAEVVLPDGFWDALPDGDPAQSLRELVEDEREVSLARRVPAEGRARGLVDGQFTTRDGVASLARATMRFSGQGESRTLTGARAQLAALDAFAGPEVHALSASLATLRRRLAALDQELASRRARRAAAEREKGDLEALIADVEALAPDASEERSLRAERERLRHSERLAEAVSAAAEEISPESGDGGALDRVGAAHKSVADMAEIDPALAGLAGELGGVQAVLQEASLTLHGYLDGLDAEPGRLDVIEARLSEYDRLGERIAPGAEALLARADEARQRLADLADGGARDDELTAQRGALAREAADAAGELRARRQAAAGPMAEAIEAELAGLAMEDARVRIELGEREGEPPHDVCTIWLRANPGLPEAPLADAASGGELSRVLLAIHGISAMSGGGAWVFDEVDAGLGGATATAVGEKLRALAERVQVIVITHLPQVAAGADRHYRLDKGRDEGGVARTRIAPLEGEELVAELCRMLGGEDGDAGARRHAEELLARRRGGPEARSA